MTNVLMPLARCVDLSGPLDAMLDLDGPDEPQPVFPAVRTVLEALAATFPSGEGPRAPAELRPETFHVTQAMADQIEAEALSYEERILRIIEAEPMGIEQLARLMRTRAGTLRPLIRTLEGSGQLETHRDRLMLGPVHVVSLPCSETAIGLVLGAFTRPQISRHDIKKSTNLCDDTIRQATMTLVQRGTLRMKFVGALPLYELVEDVAHTARSLPGWAGAQRHAPRPSVHRPGTPQVQSRLPSYARAARVG